MTEKEREIADIVAATIIVMGLLTLLVLPFI
jgi:hypothetical protein